jgi:hypothetical protein
MKTKLVIAMLFAATTAAPAVAEEICGVVLRDPSPRCNIGQGEPILTPCTGVQIVSNGGNEITTFANYEETADRFELTGANENGQILSDGGEIYTEKFVLNASLPKAGSLGTLHYSYTRKLYAYINGVNVPTGQSRVVSDLTCSATLDGIKKSKPELERSN